MRAQHVQHPGHAGADLEPRRRLPAADAALERVREAARGDENLLQPMREALAARCTVGEICNALREEFGTYDAHLAP